MAKHWFILALLLAPPCFSFAQRNNIWYFGRKAGLDFNQPSAAPLHNSAMNADEGSSTICDANGNLLFYTNGITVYNRNQDRKSTRLNSSHSQISYAVFCLKKKNTTI